MTMNISEWFKYLHYSKPMQKFIKTHCKKPSVLEEAGLSREALNALPKERMGDLLKLMSDMTSAYSLPAIKAGVVSLEQALNIMGYVHHYMVFEHINTHQGQLAEQVKAFDETAAATFQELLYGAVKSEEAYEAFTKTYPSN